MLWMNWCNAMLKWEKSWKSRKSTKVAYGSHTEICKTNESCTRSYKCETSSVAGGSGGNVKVSKCGKLKYLDVKLHLTTRIKKN